MTNKLFKNTLLIQILSVIIGVAGMLVDGAVTGHFLGTESMAAYGIVTPITTIFAACASVCGVGTSVLVGRIVGSRKFKEADKALSSCLVFTLFLSAILIIAVFTFSRAIASLLGARGNINIMASVYLKGFCFCAPAMLILIVLIPIVQIDGNGKIIIISILSMTVLNIIGDILAGIVLKAGLLGMAISTTISYFVAFTVIIIPFILKRNSIHFSIDGLNFKYVVEMLKCGLPDAFQQVCRCLLIILLNKILLKISDSSHVAILTAILSASNICMALGSGIASSTSLLTGVFSGEKDENAIRELVKIAIKYSIIYNAILCILLMAFSKFIMPLFLSDENLIKTASMGFRLYCLSMIGYSINVTLRSYYQAMHFSAISFIYVLLNSLILTSISAMILTKIFGVNGIWISFFCGEILTFIFLTLYIIREFGINDFSIDKYLLIPSDFTSDVISRFDGNIHNIEELESLSNSVMDFCNINGLSLKQSYILSLSVEEIGVRLLKNSKYVDFRLIIFNDACTLRIRDDGKKFNPLELMCYESKTDFSYAGIGMLSKLISDIEYTNTFNMNNLNIRVSRE